MKRLLIGAAVIAAAPLLAPAAPRAQAEAGGAKQADRQVTVTGCVQTEAEFRRMQDKGRGGVAGTGVGVGNEFVLISASSGADAKKGAGAEGVAYELTGANEKLAAAHVGHRVEISGTVKAGSATGGPTAGAPPRGTDVVSKDLQLRELEVSSVKMIAADCAKQ